MSVAMQIQWSFGDRLSKARRLAGLEQADLAAHIGVSRALVSKWERDVTEPSASQTVAWAARCNIDVLWLLGLAPTTTCFSAPPVWLLEPTEGQMVLPFGDRPRLVTVASSVV